MMKEIVRPAAVLLIITAVAAALLGFVSETTKVAIEEQTAKTQAEAMQAVLPDADEFKKDEAAELSGTIVSVNVGYQGGEICGYVINVQPSGFGGPIDTMVGISSDGSIMGMKVLSHSETPGLGARATEEGEGSFKSQFEGFSGNLAVTKDGGDIVPITSATITSRAVTSGVKEAVDWVAENGGAK